MNQAAENVIPIHLNYPSRLNTGSVVRADSNRIAVEISGALKEARQAFSCVVDPEPGDVVLCTRTCNRDIYILGILERPGNQKIKISFPSDTRICASQGQMNIHACDSITIDAKQVSCFSDQVIHKSRDAVVSCDNLTAKGDELCASFKTVRVISSLINTMAKQVIDKFQGYIRKTEQNDMVKSGQMTRQADGLYAVDSKYTIMKSKENTKIDGKKILMG